MTRKSGYYKRIKYFGLIISNDESRSFFFNALRSFKEIELNYDYRPDFFNYEGDIFLNLPLKKAKIIIENIELISELSKKLIPDKYQKYEHLLIDKLTSNWWIHEFLIDKYWKKKQ